MIAVAASTVLSNLNDYEPVYSLIGFIYAAVTDEFAVAYHN